LYFGTEDLEQQVETDVMDKWAAEAGDIDPDKIAVAALKRSRGFGYYPSCNGDM